MGKEIIEAEGFLEELKELIEQRVPKKRREKVAKKYISLLETIREQRKEGGINMMKKTFKKYSDAFELFEDLGISFSEEEKLFIKAMVQIGGQLLAYRKEHNLTQKELAKKLGISQSMLSKIETGDKNISIKVLAKIIAKLGGRIRISLGIVPTEIEQKYEFKGGSFLKYSVQAEEIRSVGA